MYPEMHPKIPGDTVIRVILLYCWSQKVHKRISASVVQLMGNPCDVPQFYSKQIGVIEPLWSGLPRRHILERDPNTQHHIHVFILAAIEFYFDILSLAL